MLNTRLIKEQFPVLLHNPELAYMDNGASTQTPFCVTDAQNEFYMAYRANIHRGQYPISEMATETYEEARDTIAKFINAPRDCIVFTSGATNSLNLLAYCLTPSLKAGNNVVLTRLEHHANLIPWQQMADRYGFELRFIELTSGESDDSNFLLDLESAKRLIDKQTKIVSVAHISNVLGTILPVAQIISMAKEVGAVSIIDAAQSVAHMPLDFQKLGCDALVFSGHKLYGPTGTGILSAKRDLLRKMPPFLFGGDMITDVSYEKSVWNEPPYKFEAGTPNISGVIGLAAACEFLTNLGWSDLMKHEEELTEYALQKISDLKKVRIIGPLKTRYGENVVRSGVISFVLDGVHFHDAATILADNGVCVRAGHHCAMPLMKHLNVYGTVRASLALYNTKEDVDKLIHGINEVTNIFAVEQI